MNRPAMVSAAAYRLRSRFMTAIPRAVGRSTVGLLALIAASTGACASAGSFIWVNEAPDAYFKPAPALTISSGDIISVKVFGQDPLSVKALVRPDGAIAMPLIGDIQVGGKSPNIVAREVEARLVPYVTTPNVVVVVEESRIRVVSIGEVRRTGTIVLEAGETGMLAALANAGGLTDFADDSQVYVLRQSPTGVIRIRFRYDEIIRGVGRAAAFRLRSGDQIVVE